ncbi:hypothetical protein EBU71_21120, partial [bacterium]|nr:hypothetical protein [Candidatus Elulimicrobium humile]
FLVMRHTEEETSRESPVIPPLNLFFASIFIYYACASHRNTIVSDPVTTTQTTSSSPYIFTGLTTGSAYTFSATATNSNGASLPSASSNQILISLPGDFESIATVNVTSPQSTITFNSIPQTYKHLQLRITGRGTNSSAFQELAMTANGTSSIYSRHLLYGDGSSIGVDGRQTGDAGFFMSWIAGGNAGSNIHGVCIVDILDYTNTNKSKVASVLTTVDRNGSGVVGIESSIINTTNPITSLSFITQLPGNNFDTNSSFALYGIKG